MKSFHAYRLDKVNHCLWRGEERLSLAPKAFDVLRYLVEHADRLVTQEEILEALWPETYVNPEVIKKYVLGIRKVLGDRSDNPAFIATFPRRGYQFIAPLRNGAKELHPEVPATASKPIVGRAGALAELGEAFRKASQGQRQIVFITGEAGIGKTTLVDLFLQAQALRDDVSIARGQCVEGFGGKEAYYPILEALGQFLRDGEDNPLLRSFFKYAPTWLAQFPFLVNSEKREALEKEIIGSTRERMVREICEGLEAITAQNPLVLCLEDLHWVDPSTLDFISALARRRGPAKLLFVGTYRPADVIISQSPLKTLKQDLVLHKLGQEIGLERLEEPDVAEYLRAKFTDSGFPAEFSGTIHGHSGGNALFMETILQDMEKKQLIQEVGGKWMLKSPLEEVVFHVPETLDQLIEAQFRQLSELERRILSSASVAGERFSAWAIAAAAEVEPGTIEDVCEGLAERLQFIKALGVQELANGQVSTHYEFVHSLYREVLYRRLSEVARSKLHLLLGKRLQAFCNPCEQELATELALHFEGGYDHQEAIRYLILAAENAARRFAYRESSEILRHALDLTSKVRPELRAELSVRILEGIGDVQLALGALPESAEAYSAAASRADTAGLHTSQVQALICAMYPLGFINPDRGLAAIDRAVQMSLSVGEPLLLARTQMLAACGRLAFDKWSQKDAALCQSAYQTLRESGELQRDAYQQVTYGHFLTLRGQYREALRMFDAATSRMQHGVGLIPHFGALSGSTIALLRLGRFGEVLRITRAGQEFPDGNRARVWLLSFREAWLRILAFDYHGALQICENICGSSGKYHSAQPHTIAQIAAGYIELGHGEYRRALERFGEVCKPDRPGKFYLHWIWRMTAQLECSNAWLLSGNLSRARSTAEPYLEKAFAAADPHLQALAWDLKARIALTEDDVSGAAAFIQQALTIVEEFEVVAAAWQIYATAWRVYESLGDYESAEINRERAEASIFTIADSFTGDEPLRASFLHAAPIRNILDAARPALV
jgi:DNA-binding winged helix-turn-helix (wHTH) protein/tetratricopeptide (TPR) repeat protein